MEKVIKSQYIHDDIAFSILSKLPIKSFKRFESVCKSWSLLFDNPNFMKFYGKSFLTKDHSIYDDTSLLLHKKIDGPWDGDYWDETFELYSVSGKRFENMVKLDWPNVKLDPVYWYKTEYDSGFNILGSGSVHGTLCLSCAFKTNIILWNPSTKEFKIIPPSSLSWAESHAFGFDSVKEDYKVMCLGVVQSEIYSLRCNSWRKIDVNMQPIRNNYWHYDQLYTDGLSHWLSQSETNNVALTSFDWSNEVFFKTSLPSDTDSVWKHLVLLNGSIALILNHTDTATFHISILGALGVMESWTKVFIVGPLPCLDYRIGVGKKGDILFRKKDGGLVRLNLSTQKIEKLGIIIERYCKILIHKESLLPFEGANI
jgi:molecular chaperone HtpG